MLSATGAEGIDRQEWGFPQHGRPPSSISLLEPSFLPIWIALLLTAITTVIALAFHLFKHSDTAGSVGPASRQTGGQHAWGPGSSPGASRGSVASFVAGRSLGATTQSARCSSRPTVSIYIDHIFHPTLTPATLQKNFESAQEGQSSTISLDATAVEHLKTLAELSELFVISRADSDEEERLIDRFIAKILGGCQTFRPHRSLFSSSDEGRASMVRQLQPTIHIDDNPGVVSTLGRRVPNVVLIQRAQQTSPQNPSDSSKSSGPLLPSVESDHTPGGIGKIEDHSAATLPSASATTMPNKVTSVETRTASNSSGEASAMPDKSRLSLGDCVAFLQAMGIK